MIVDTSAVLAIVFGEPGFEVFAGVIASASIRRISVASFVEASIVAEARGGYEGARLCESFFRESALAIESVTSDQALVARQGFSDYGKGRHPAGLNFGDCFAYALAKSTDEPLLFKGEDFRKTDIRPAI